MADHYLNDLLGEREKLILLTHQHWFTILPSIISNVLIALVIVAISVGVYTYVLANQLVLLLLGLLSIPIIRLIDRYMKWINEEYAITNFRVIQIRGVFSKDVIDSSLEKVNDLKMNQSFFGRIFNFGDIEILTASELGVNKLKRILNPIGFKTAMLNAKEELEHNAAPVEPAVQENKEDILRLIAKLDQLHLTGDISDEEFKQKKAELLSRL